MTVSNPASFSSIRAEFGGSANFKDYYRGGPYVAAGAAAQISTTVDGLRMSQFNGVTKPSSYTPVSVSVSPVNSSRSFNTGSSGTLGTDTFYATASGGNGSYSYSWAITYGSLWNISAPTSSATFFSHNVTKNGEWDGGARVTVSDGVSSAYFDVTFSIVNGTPV